MPASPYRITILYAVPGAATWPAIADFFIRCVTYVTACLDAGVPLRDVQIAVRHSDPRMTTRYDRARGNLDRHANYIVVGFIEGPA
ncbi:MAG: hypothetical protein ACYCV4_13220 [Dermatophilaceae bacterium]